MKHLLYGPLVLAFLSLIAGCSSETTSTSTASPIDSTMTKDRHTAAEPGKALVTHTHLDLLVDFTARQLRGVATLTINNKTKCSELLLDTRHLAIDSVWAEDGKQALPFQVLDEKKYTGSPLRISISGEPTQIVKIKYHTTEGADALQWLDASQTAGKQHPFLFTQGQAILSRTWFPCQDSPGIRFTYSAKVTVPEGLRAIMSASESKEEAGQPGLFYFKMDKPIPAYLVALAVGDIQYQPINERTGVYAEPSMLAKSATEFSDMGKMVDAAESIYGPYRWGKYDVLVLPPSFPFGGMENPCVTFATPTILAGDKSLTSLIAHELAHSWSGNLVTNATWNDFWLNEGFTVYFERRIMEQLEGKDYADMLALLGYQDLQNTLEELGKDSPATHLKLSLDEADPDDGMNDIAYEKGYLFLCHLEKLAGRDKWDAFVRHYFDSFAFQSMTTEKFVEYLTNELLTPNGISPEQANCKAWIYSPGLPDGVVVPESNRFKVAEQAMHQFLSKGNTEGIPTIKWSSHEWLHFLRSFPAKMDAPKLQALDKQFHFTQSGNSELLFEWLMMCVRNQYRPPYSKLEDFLVHTGRRKFVLPLYKELISNGQKAMAQQVFNKARGNYHSVTRQSVEAALSKESTGV